MGSGSWGSLSTWTQQNWLWTGILLSLLDEWVVHCSLEVGSWCHRDPHTFSVKVIGSASYLHWLCAVGLVALVHWLCITFAPAAKITVQTEWILTWRCQENNVYDSCRLCSFKYYVCLSISSIFMWARTCFACRGANGWVGSGRVG